jgi:hypothetical protein
MLIPTVRSKAIVCPRPALLLLLLAGACTGNVADPSPSGSPGPSAPPALPAPAAPVGGTALGPDRAAPGCQAIAPGPSPLRRLTRFEYDNTVRDLLGDRTRPGHDFPVEERALGFDNGAESRSVSSLLADRYFAAASQLAAAAVTRLPDLLPCDPAREGDGPCLDRFLDGFGKRAWRRPLAPAERENLRRTFADSKGDTFARRLEAVIQVMLLSPQFLYRVERGTAVPGAPYLRLTPWELASRLSYLLWGSLPDEPLMAAAEAGQLATAPQVLEQARRMVKDPRAGAMVTAFSDEWLRLEELADLDKEAAVFPAFTPELRGPLRAETEALIDDVLWKGDGKLSTLLEAPFTFVNGPLARFYGTPGVTGDAFQKVPQDASKRLGVLGHAGILAVLGVPDTGLTSLVYRGLFVRERLLCDDLPDPPPNAAAMNPPFSPTTTAREWSLARQQIALCGACHHRMDPIGFGLESFDGIGQWRATDRGKPVDASGQLEGTDVDGPFVGLPELAHKLARSKQVHDCLALQWFRFGYGRKEETEDACSVGTLRRVFSSSQGDIRELLVALTQTDAFLYRSPGGQP